VHLFVSTYEDDPTIIIDSAVADGRIPTARTLDFRGLFASPDTFFANSHSNIPSTAIAIKQYGRPRPCITTCI